MLLNTLKPKINNSSTTSLVQHHAQPVEEHANSVCMEEFWAIKIRAIPCIEMVDYLCLDVWMFQMSAILIRIKWIVTFTAH